MLFSSSRAVTISTGGGSVMEERICSQTPGPSMPGMATGAVVVWMKPENSKSQVSDAMRPAIMHTQRAAVKILVPFRVPRRILMRIVRTVTPAKGKSQTAGSNANGR